MADNNKRDWGKESAEQFQANNLREAREARRKADLERAAEFDRELEQRLRGDDDTEEADSKGATS